MATGLYTTSSDRTAHWGGLTPEEFREKNITCNPVRATNLQVEYAVG